MKKFLLLFAAFALGAMIVNCSPKKVVHPEKQAASSQETAQKAAESRAGGDMKARASTPSVAHQGSQEKASDIKTSDRQPLEQQLIVKEERQAQEPTVITQENKALEDIYFDYDRFDITADARSSLKKIADWMRRNPSARILVEGHCDERGTNEYNLALGDNRAKAARDYLLALGIAQAKIEMISYGEEKPQCADQTEECWQKNRRAHFVIQKESR
jgi:peptidoglycan-associated lipoprotein